MELLLSTLSTRVGSCLGLARDCGMGTDTLSCEPQGTAGKGSNQTLRIS